MTRAEIKNMAKQRLERNIFGNCWMMALLVCLIQSAILTAGSTIVPGIGSILLTGPLTFGLNFVFLKLVREGGTPQIGDLFAGFSEDFGQNLLIGLLSGIFAFLWGLLLIIPGIVKTYAYSMAFYIKSDNPDYNWRDCIQGSCELMRGHKWELFVLDLSFLGWYIVGALCFGLGTLWVVPYHMEARAVFYDQLCGGARGGSRLLNGEVCADDQDWNGDWYRE